MRGHAPDGRSTSRARVGDERAPRDLQRAVGGGVWSKALGERGLDLGDLALGAGEHGVVEAAREIECRLPQLGEARVAAAELECLDPDLGEAGLLEQLAD